MVYHRTRKEGSESPVRHISSKTLGIDSSILAFETLDKCNEAHSAAGERDPLQSTELSLSTKCDDREPWDRGVHSRVEGSLPGRPKSLEVNMEISK